MLISFFFAVKGMSHVLSGDEIGYLNKAQNLLNGFYSPDYPNIHLWWGPGYPIFVAFFLFCGFSTSFVILLNAILLYLTSVLLFKSVCRFSTFKWSLIITFFFALCFTVYPYTGKLLTEILTIFLLSSFAYSTIMYYQSNRLIYMLAAGFSLGYVALTKVIFGYVIVFILIASLLVYLVNKVKTDSRKFLYISLCSIITALPYLLYTYQLTGRVLYWGNSGGMSLYWITTPYPLEYGTLNSEDFDANRLEESKDQLINSTELLMKNHGKDIEYVKQFVGVEKDDAYKKIAIENIKKNPGKYLKNVMSNLSCLFFGFPTNYTLERPLSKVWYFSIIYSLTLLALVLMILKWKYISFDIKIIFIVLIVYMIGSALVSGSNRQLIVVVPIILIWIAYLFQRFFRFL